MKIRQHPYPQVLQHKCYLHTHIISFFHYAFHFFNYKYTNYKQYAKQYAKEQLHIKYMYVTFNLRT